MPGVSSHRARGTVGSVSRALQGAERGGTGSRASAGGPPGVGGREGCGLRTQWLACTLVLGERSL